MLKVFFLFATKFVELGSEHSAVLVTSRFTHKNLDSKKAAVAKLESFGDDLVTVCTKMQHWTPELSLNAPLKAVASYT